MAYRTRSFQPGTPSHLSARGVNDLRIFPTAVDCYSFLARLREVTTRAGWSVIAWCLMGTHYHLLVATPSEPRIPWAMQALNSVYAREFNHRHGRRGHVFGERYADTVVATEEHLRAAVDYILENPLRAGLVRRVEDWPWSGDHRLEPRRVRTIVTDPRGSRDILVRLAR